MVGVSVLFYLFFSMTALTLLEPSTENFRLYKTVIVSFLAVTQLFVMLQRNISAFSWQRILQAIGILSVLIFMVWYDSTPIVAKLQ